MNKIICHAGLSSESDFSFERFSSDRTTYEVIRVINGVALFLEDHFQRLQESFVNQNRRNFTLDFEEFRLKIEDLVVMNKRTEGNIKFVCLGSEEEMEWAFFFIPHLYPESEDYRNGVTTNLLFQERKNPNAKVVQNSVRDKANQLIAEQHLYEVLLVDREGKITEGSRSNVFFVKDEVFYTAPSSKVLVGITRQKVLECLNELGFHIIERLVDVNEISRFDAVFLTGTSPKVLPVRCIGTQLYETQLHCVKMLMDSYDRQIVQYISQNSLKR
jgi:branched-chain amino acid aminotransferase